MDYIVHGIFQAGILEWIAFPFARGSSQPRDQTQVSQHCRRILYKLSHKGRPRILQWVAYTFSRESSRPRNWTGVSCIEGRFFTNLVLSLSLSFGEMKQWVWSASDLHFKSTRLSNSYTRNKNNHTHTHTHTHLPVFPPLQVLGAFTEITHFYMAGHVGADVSLAGNDSWFFLS